MVKDDGTVVIDVPGSHSPIETGVITNEAHDVSFKRKPSQDIRPVQPLQIVMLIVGTRGDVQPFVAIGKRLQVFCIPGFLSIPVLVFSVWMIIY